MKTNKKTALHLCTASLISLVVIAGAYLAPAITLANTPVVDLSEDLQPSAPVNHSAVALNATPPPPQYTQNSEYPPSPSTDTITTTPQPNIPAPAHGEPSFDTMDEQSAPAAMEGNPNAADYSALPTEQRLARLEQQMQNFANMNLAQQISQLQQQIQQLNGQLQQQSHQLQEMTAKLHQLKIKTHKDINTTAAPQTIKPSAPSSSVQTQTITTAKNDLSVDDTAYQSALNFLNNKQYPQAENAFKQYVQHYPQGKFAANAHYWLGELYLLDKNSFAAANQFSTVIRQPGTSGKAADARLKLAMIHVQQGQTQTARNEFKQIQQNYPGTTAAHLAEIQLQQLKLSK